MQEETSRSLQEFNKSPELLNIPDVRIIKIAVKYASSCNEIDDHEIYKLNCYQMIRFFNYI